MKSISLNILSGILIGLKDGLSYREIQNNTAHRKVLLLVFLNDLVKSFSLLLIIFVHEQ